MAMNRIEAERRAQSKSLEHKGVTWYVSWIEGNEYTIDTKPDYEDQEFYLNGRRWYPAEYEESFN